MSRRLVAYDSDDESPDKRRSRDESSSSKREYNQKKGARSPEEWKSKMRKIRKNSERWTASSDEESERGNESATSNTESSKSDSERHPSSSRQRSSLSNENRNQYDLLKPPKLPSRGLDLQLVSHLPVTQSQSSLVSYGAAEDEEEDQFAKADKRAIELKREKQDLEDRSRSSTVVREPKPPRGHEDSRSPDEIAVDNILEEGVRELAQGFHHGGDSSAIGSTPHSLDGIESPIPVVPEEEIVLPPTPPGRCSPRLEKRFEAYFDRKAANYDLNQIIKKRRDFKNPSMYKQLIDKFHVDELGSNFNPRVFDPHGFTEDCFYDAIGAMQKEVMEKHNAAAEKRAAAAKNESAKASEARRKSRFEGTKKH